MTNFNFLSNNLSYLSSEDHVGRPMDSTCFRSAPVPPSFRLRLHPLRMVATLLFLLCLGVGNVSGATYNLVTDVSSLSAGDVILIVSPAGSINYNKKTYYYNPQSMTSTASGVRLGCTEVTISSTSITSTTAEEWTLSGSSGSWKLNSGNKYLYAEAKNQLSTTTTPANGLVFGLAIDNDNKAWFTVTVGSNACKLQMNASYSGGVQTFFALYTSNQKPIYIYKKVPSCTPLGTINGSVYLSN